MLIQGLQYMVIGMGVVFFFLVIMVISMNIMSAVIAKYNEIYPEQVEEETKPASSGNGNNEEIALVLAAVKAFS